MTAADLLEAQRLRARLLLGHVVHAEELVVAEQQTIHHSTPSASSAVAGRFVGLRLVVTVPLPATSRRPSPRPRSSSR